MQWEFIKFIADTTKIERFILNHHFNKPTNDQIHFSELKHFGYGGGRNEFPIAFTFDQLETFEVKLIHGNYSGINLNQIDDIIRRNEKLTTICIGIEDETDLDTISTSSEIQKPPYIVFKSLDYLFENSFLDINHINNAMVEFLNQKSLATKIIFETIMETQFESDLLNKIHANK